MPLFAAVLLGLAISGCKGKKTIESGSDSIRFSTKTEDLELLRSMGMASPSEDASYLLDTNKLSVPHHLPRRFADTTNKGVPDKRFDKYAMIILYSDTEFNGMRAWDALQSTGLKWGDGDLFHWVNNDANYGDDDYFSVGTNTAPGYFLPEEVKAGNMNPKDLVFAFPVPRNSDPKNVFSAMIAAAKYCQKKLGGHLVDENYLVFDEQMHKAKLDTLLAEMKASGLVPGSDKALMTY